MTFRDDHDAAIARADALEDEVERQRERADAQAKEAAKLRRERDELEARVARLEAGKKVPEKPRVSEETARTVNPKPYGRASDEHEILFLAAIMFALFIVALVIGVIDHNK